MITESKARISVREDKDLERKTERDDLFRSISGGGLVTLMKFMTSFPLILETLNITQVQYIAQISM